MIKKGNKFLKLGRILFYLSIAYFLVLPILGIFVLSIFHTGGGSEFDGLWLFLIFPHLELFYCGYDVCYNSLSLPTIALLLTFALMVMLSAKYIVKRHLKFELGYHWTLIFTAVFALSSIILINQLWYPYSVKDTSGWSDEAIESNDAQLCLEKLEKPYDQVKCLYKAAITSGELQYCGALEEFANGDDEYYGFDANDCLVTIQVIKNFSSNYCDSDYSYDCLQEECSYDKLDCYSQAVDGYMESLTETLAYNAQDQGIYETLYKSVDTNLCSFYTNLPSSTAEDMTDCYTNIFGTYTWLAARTQDTSWCDKIDATNETYVRFSEQCYENLRD